MLGVSFSELAITCVIAFLVMRPQDIKKVIYWYKYISKQIIEIRDLAQESIDEINNGFEETTANDVFSKKSNYVIDDNNALQRTYDDDPLKKNGS